MASGRIRIGLSGWTYDSWRGSFYQVVLPRRRQLEYASREFDTLDINGSFYSLRRRESYKRWARGGASRFRVRGVTV